MTSIKDFKDILNSTTIQQAVFQALYEGNDVELIPGIIIEDIMSGARGKGDNLGINWDKKSEKEKIRSKKMIVSNSMQNNSLLMP